MVLFAIVLGYYTNFASIIRWNFLFFIFAADQLLFRLIDNAEPGRLLGQMVYFGAFLGIISLAARYKK